MLTVMVCDAEAARYPLSGVRVLDISQYESGPLCAQFLGWYGADVIRVDDLVDQNQLNHPALHYANNNNKRSISVDLRSDEGRRLVARLSADVDIVVENFAVGVAERLGLDYASLSTGNPALVYCTIKGFGLSGPMAGYRSFDPIAQAAGGAMSMNGDEVGSPMPTSFLLADNVSGATAVSGVLAAYIHRLKTGRGQLVEVSMQDAILSVVRSKMLAWQPNDGPAPRGGATHPPGGVYACLGGGPNDYIQISTPDERIYRRLVEAIGKPELAADERFATLDARRRNADQLHEQVASWTSTMTKWDAASRLADCKVPASPVFDSADIGHSEHLRERRSVVDLDDGRWLVGCPVRLHSTQTPFVAAPTVGANTDAVLSEFGISDFEIAELGSKNIIRQARD